MSIFGAKQQRRFLYLPELIPRGAYIPSFATQKSPCFPFIFGRSCVRGRATTPRSASLCLASTPLGFATCARDTTMEAMAEDTEVDTTMDTKSVQQRGIEISANILRVQYIVYSLRGPHEIPSTTPITQSQPSTFHKHSNISSTFVSLQTTNRRSPIPSLSPPADPLSFLPPPPLHLY